MTFAHLALSALISMADSSGVFALPSKPKVANRSFTSASSISFAISRLRSASISCGVPAGATIPSRASQFGGSDAPTWTAWTAAFAERLRQLGWIDGRTVAIEYRWSEGRPKRVAEVADELVRQKVDIIVTYGSAVAAFKQATRDIPIVFAIAVDPVGIGLVDSLSRPGGNVTGLSLEVRSSLRRAWAILLHPSAGRPDAAN